MGKQVKPQPFHGWIAGSSPAGSAIWRFMVPPKYFLLSMVIGCLINCDNGVLLTRDPLSLSHAALVLVVSTSVFQTESTGSSPVCCSTRKGNSTVDDRRKPTVFPAGGLKYQHIKGKASIRKWLITCVSFREFTTKNNITQLSSLLGPSAKE